MTTYLVTIVCKSRETRRRVGSARIIPFDVPDGTKPAEVEKLFVDGWESGHASSFTVPVVIDVRPASRGAAK